jgi:uncharacterized protein YkwD
MKINNRTLVGIAAMTCSIIALLAPGCNSDNPVSPPLASMEQDVHAKINAHRSLLGLPALTLDETISAQARKHSQDMADQSVLSHDGFDDRAAVIEKTIPLDSIAENVAVNVGVTDPATTAVNGWLNSPGHKKNIEDGYDLTGIGIVRNSKGEFYFTQIFLKKK